MKRVGVFICHCGTNIASTVDVKKVAAAAAEMPNVAFATDYQYMCSEPGQDLIRQAIAEHNLDRVVVASCTPRLHETTFRKACESGGINQFLMEMANIREQCAWVHKDKEKATEKAIDLVRSAVAKVVKNEPLELTTIPIERRALVIGAGIAGMRQPLMWLMPVTKWFWWKEPTIGGNMVRLDKTFPTWTVLPELARRKWLLRRSTQHKTLTYSEVEEIGGYVGNFTVKIRKKARLVDESKCTGCGLCQENAQRKYPAV